MPQPTSQHILNTSANLLGFCLVVITSFHIRDGAAVTIIDEITSLIACLLSLSCFFSYASIRSAGEERAQKLEKVADLLFISSLGGILVTIALISFALVK